MSGTPTEPDIRVLHVDDESVQLRLAKQMIEMADPSLVVTSTTQPLEVTRKLLEARFDCVVTDYRMPEVNGIELARRIRELPDPPVIIIYTSHGSEDVASEAFAAGVDDYVRKEIEPAHYEVLARRIRSAVERRRVEERYRAIAERWRMFANAATDSLILYDRNLRLVEANDAALRSWGRTRQDALGKHITELHPLLKGTGRLEVYHRILETGEPHVFENVLVQYANETRRKTIRAFRVGDYLGILSFDITERLASEEQIRASAEKYQAISDRLITYLDAATDAISLFDKDLHLLEANKVALQNWGLSREDAVGRHFTVIHRDVKASGRYDLYLSVLKTGVPIRLDGAAIDNALGRRRKIVQAFRVGEGLGVISTDVTDLLDAEEKLKLANRLFRLLSDSNRAMMRIRSEDDLLNAVCRAIVDTGGFRTAWIGFPNSRGELEARVAYGMRSKNILERPLSLHDPPSRDHPAVTALRGSPVVINRLSEIPVPEPARSLMHAGGWKSVAAIPLKSAGAAFGVIVIDSGVEETFGAEEVGILLELGDNLAFRLRGSDPKA